MKISLTQAQIDSILLSELKDRLANCDNTRLSMALTTVLESLEGEQDELQDIVSETAC